MWVYIVKDWEVKTRLNSILYNRAKVAMRCYSLKDFYHDIGLQEVCFRCVYKRRGVIIEGNSTVRLRYSLVRISDEEYRLEFFFTCGG